LWQLFFDTNLNHRYIVVRVHSAGRYTLQVQLMVAVLVGALAFVLGYQLIPATLGIEVVRYATKPLFHFIYAVIAVLSIRELRAAYTGSASARLYWMLFLAALFGVCIIASHNSYGYKVLSDEYVVCSQAKSMYFQGTSDYPVGTFLRYGEVKPLSSLVDKRPPSFSALLAVVHDLSGYRVGNVFVLNSVLCFALIWLLLCAALRFAPEGLGRSQLVAWVLCLLFSLPLLGQVATGAGIDLYNLFLLAASALLAWRVLEQLDAESCLLWLLVSFLLFNARYESVLYVLSVGAILVLKSYRMGRVPEFAAVCLLPVGLVFFLLRHKVFDALPELSWQVDAGTQAFSFSYFARNAGHAIGYLYEIDRQSSGSCALAYLGSVALLVLLVRGMRKWLTGHKASHQDLVLIAYGAVVCINFMLLMCYHWGRIDELEVSRLALPLFLLFGACIFRVLQELYRNGATRIAQVLLAVAVTSVVLISMPSVSAELRLKNNYHAQMDAWALRQIETQGDPAAMVVTSGTLFWDLHQIAAQHPSHVVAHLQDFEFHRANRSFNPYLLEQVKIDPLTGELTVLGGVDLGRQYSTQILAEMPYKPYHYARLSKLLEPKADALKLGELEGPALEFYQRYPIEYWFMRIP
jgi:hypothetical protein